MTAETTRGNRSARSAVIDRRYRQIEPPGWGAKKPPPENRRRSNKSVDETNYET
jgi:hypothetical protein